MRKCIPLLLLSCLFCLSLPAQEEEHLIGRWLPQHQNLVWDETCDQVSNFWIMNVTGTDSLILESPGANTGQKYFSLHLQGDSLFMYNQSDSVKMFIEELNSDKLVLSYTKERKVTYIKMPQLDLVGSESIVNKILDNNLLEFRSLSDESFNFQVELSPILIDSGLILTPFLSIIKSAKMRMHTQVTEREVYWALGNHGSDLVFRLFNIDSNLDLALIIKEVTADYLLFEYWSCKGKELIEARIMDVNKMQELRKRLTKHSWKLKNSNPHDSYFDMGMISNNWYKSENYYKDSSLIITDADVVNRSLKINFTPSNVYEVYRNKRLLDTGKWHMMFDGKTLKLESSRQNSEGMLGGYVFLEEITKRKLKLVRRWTMEKDFGQVTKNSDLETYKAIKK